MEFRVELIAIHLAIYIGLIFILKKMYFDPVLALIKKRDALTTGRKEVGDGLVKKISDLKEKYNLAVTQVRNDNNKKRQAVLSEARDKARQSIDVVAKENTKHLVKLQSELDEELDGIRKKLPDEGLRLGDNIIEAVMSAKVVRL